MSTRDVQTARRALIFEDVASGLTGPAILAKHEISHDTFARDLRALSASIGKWAEDKQRMALAMAIATNSRVVDELWRLYDARTVEWERWLAGDYDRTAYLPAMDGGTVEEKKPPPFDDDRVKILAQITTTVRDMCKLAGLLVDRQQVEQSGDIVMRIICEDAPPHANVHVTEQQRPALAPPAQTEPILQVEA